MYNARDKVTSAKCCSLYQKPEHIDTDNQRARCQKYLYQKPEHIDTDNQRARCQKYLYQKPEHIDTDNQRARCQKYLYQKPEHIDTDNQRARCQKYLRTNYKANYKYTAGTRDDSKLNRCVEKSGVFSGVRT